MRKYWVIGVVLASILLVVVGQFIVRMSYTSNLENIMQAHTLSVPPRDSLKIPDYVSLYSATTSVVGNYITAIGGILTFILIIIQMIEIRSNEKREFKRLRLDKILREKEEIRYFEKYISEKHDALEIRDLQRKNIHRGVAGTEYFLTELISLCKGENGPRFDKEEKMIFTAYVYNVHLVLSVAILQESARKVYEDDSKVFSIILMTPFRQGMSYFCSKIVEISKKYDEEVVLKHFLVPKIWKRLVDQSIEYLALIPESEVDIKDML